MSFQKYRQYVTGKNMAQRYNTGNPRPSNSMKDVNDNALANDDYLNSEADTFIDRLGNERDTLRGANKKMLAAGAQRNSPEPDPPESSIHDAGRGAG
jgi:hypothetical protein